VLCSDARLRFEGGGAELVGDPTEGALLASAARAGLSIEGVRRRHARLDVVPFASERGWMATLDAGPRGEEIQVKGGVEQVLLRSATMADPDGRAVPLDPGRVLDEAAALAAEGYRVIALAAAPPAEATRIDDPELPPLTFLGLQGMLDPPRPEAQAAVARCRDARIAVKMVTGDQLETARAIARRIGISGRREPVAVSGAEIERAERRELPELVERADVFARVSPEQKLRLVEAFQARGEVVAMTGDGVNDAPALRQADLGIAIGGTGTEVAKEASDIVLADDNFATIAAAVEEGRRIFDNITKFLVWTLPTNLGEGLVILAAILVGATLPILPSQILWINMTTAVALGLMLSFEPLEPDAMRRPPRRLTEPLLSGVLIERIVLASGLMVAGSFGLFELELRLGASVEEARTVAVNVFVAAEAFYLLTCRSLSRSFLSVGLFSNRWVVVGVACQVVLQAAFTYLPAMNALFDTAPVAAESWVRIIAVGIAVALVAGAHKAIRRRWSWPATPAAA
jgi:cation-transporting ATPase F